MSYAQKWAESLLKFNELEYIPLIVLANSLISAARYHGDEETRLQREKVLKSDRWPQEAINEFEVLVERMVTDLKYSRQVNGFVKRNKTDLENEEHKKMIEVFMIERKRRRISGILEEAENAN